MFVIAAGCSFSCKFNTKKLHDKFEGLVGLPTIYVSPLKG